MQKPCLLIDFDGTLCYDKYWRSFDPAQRTRVREYLFIDNKHIVDEWMKGMFTSEEINRKLAKDLSIDYNKLWSVFVKDCKEMFVDYSTLGKIQELKQRYKTILVTDNMDCFDRFTVPTLGLRQYFDGVINSYNEGMSKGDNAGYLLKRIINDWGCDVANSVIIDNSERICGIFSRLGGRSFCATHKELLSFWLERM